MREVADQKKDVMADDHADVLVKSFLVNNVPFICHIHSNLSPDYVPQLSPGISADDALAASTLCLPRPLS